MGNHGKIDETFPYVIRNTVDLERREADVN